MKDIFIFLLTKERRNNKASHKMFLYVIKMIKLKNGPLYQWDLNRYVEIDDKDKKVSEVQVCLEGDENTFLVPFTRNGDKVEAVIPNSFLQQDKKIYVFAVQYEQDEVITEEHKIFSIIPRTQPTDYVYEESEVLKFNHMETMLRQELALKADLDENGKIKAEQLSDETFTNVINLALKNAEESGAFKGDNGITPVKGKDYFTEADKREIVIMLAESLSGKSVIGYVDSSNNIVVQGNLPYGSYSVRYEMENGSTVEIGNLVISDSSEEPEMLVNIISTSLDVNLTDIYNSKGWKENIRWSTSGQKETNGTNCIITGLIPVGESGDVYRTKGATFVYNDAVSGGQILFFDESGTLLTTAFCIIENYATLGADEDGNPTFVFNTSELPEGAYYFRVTLSPLVANPILTRNQRITM